ncbi:disease resistance protein RPV1-like isoform X2 [Macadamia integrifolia]|uniref:disease resistance protein RPV1-like isoform X2 n=1 Tax=Macadamia integrifolia TaxID=60698 RepID=UPI001C4EEF35|nr:disease resistance protein RPV1-like isoform X2 [Macadamia integrifolia]
MAALDWGCSSSSSAFTTGSSSYDVFLNFRGKDTRNNFTGFLYKALKDGGINVFIDSQNLWTGEAVGPALGRAIEGSKISIPIFSKGYAHSKWCLRELSHIVQCHRSKGQLVLPIFFHVDPSHVRNQTGRFKAAFQEHKKNFTHDIVKGWKDDLEVVGNLKGEVLDETRDQAELVELVVKRVLGELVNTTHLALCKYPIGINSPLNNVLSLLDIGSNDVQFVGICGFGGIGKTTIVKAVYNDIFLNFNRHSFLSDVKEQAMQGMGLVSLQKQLLKDIFRMDIDIANYHRGKKLIEERLCKEKVLLVLDDVDNQEQIDALAGELNWFGQGSRIIITTRDEHILNVAKISKDKTYWPQVLDHKESLQLFSLHAFSMDQPPNDYIQLSYDVACYSGGLPLTLEVLGSYLADITDKELWESTLQKLKKIPHERVQRRLKISYDNLEDHYQKAIFLDAACFFIGWDKETLISIWEACGYFPKSAIIRLIKRSLLKFEDNEYGCCCLRMHDQIRDMGRDIVKEENLMEPGKRSRLWSHGEILEVIKGYKGTDMIKGMILRSSMLSDYLSSEHFVNMSNLRFLGIDSAKFNGDFSRLPSELRSLIWECKTCDVLPTNFFHKRLVYLNLSSSEIKQAWNIEPQNENKFQELKVLDLNDCRYLYMSPNFSLFPCLERLDLGHCYSLDKLDESIGQLSQLKSLVLESCNKLKNLPESIGDLKSLVKLDLSWTQMEELPDNISKLISLKDLNLKSCNSLKKLPESIGDLKYLVELQLSNVSRLKQLPESIGDLKSLVKLDLSQTQMEELPNSICRLSSLKELILKDCISPNELPKSIGDLKSLVKLELSGTQMVELPDSICRLSSLKELILRTSLKKLPKSIGDLKSLVKLDLSCTQIIELPDSISRLSSLKELILEFCKSLKKLPESIGDLKSLCELKLTSVSGIKELPKGVGLLEKLEVLDCCELVKLPVSMGRMRCLHSVNLQRTNITKLPDDFSMLWWEASIAPSGSVTLEKLEAIKAS